MKLQGCVIRNHVWVVNGIICDILSSKKKSPVDIQIFDYKQCFDSLWLKDCLNDIYTGGLNDDKLALLYNINNNVKVAVKTPVGKTDHGNIENAIIQGDVFAPILCSRQVDTIGKECIENVKYTYMYTNEVEIPPLSMVDDVLCIFRMSFPNIHDEFIHEFLNKQQETSIWKHKMQENSCWEVL